RDRPGSRAVIGQGAAGADRAYEGGDWTPGRGNRQEASLAQRGRRVLQEVARHPGAPQWRVKTRQKRSRRRRRLEVITGRRQTEWTGATRCPEDGRAQ